MTRDAFAVSIAVFLGILAKIIESVMLPRSGGPDILVILAGCVGWSCDLWNAAPAGFALGLIEDLILGRALGARAISLALAASAASLLKYFINPDSLSSKVFAALASATVADLVTWGILSSMGIGVTSSHFLRAIWVPSALWSALLICPLDAVMRKSVDYVDAIWPSSGKKGRETAI